LATNQELLENLWSSNDINKMARFYSLNTSINGLVKFSRNRPRAEITIHKKRWAKSPVVVVIPTADANGILARNVTSIFSPLPIVLTQSNGRYFNYGRSLNAGISEALNADPTWVIIANDDLIHVGNTNKLVELLGGITNAEVVLAKPSQHGSAWQHSALLSIEKNSKISDLMWSLLWSFMHTSLSAQLISSLVEKRYGLQYQIAPIPESILQNRSLLGLDRQRTYYLFHSIHARKTGIYFRNFSAFGAFRSSILARERFDETFINGYEDTDFSFRLWLQKRKVVIANYKIAHLGGYSLSRSRKAMSIRIMHEVFNKLYFSFKNRNLIREAMSSAKETDAPSHT
jgi:GT2 family glycosyltransferase